MLTKFVPYVNEYNDMVPCIANVFIRGRNNVHP